MNVREVLENYNVYKARISITEEEIKQYKDEMYSIKSSNLDGMPKPTGFTTSKIDETVARVNEKIEVKQKYIDSLKTKIKITDDLIKTLKQYNQNIIIMRFHKKMDIKQIAKEKDRDYTAIQKTIKISISKMQKEYNKSHEK